MLYPYYGEADSHARAFEGGERLSIAVVRASKALGHLAAVAHVAQVQLIVRASNRAVRAHNGVCNSITTTLLWVCSQLCVRAPAREAKCNVGFDILRDVSEERRAWAVVHILRQLLQPIEACLIVACG